MKNFISTLFFIVFCTSYIFSQDTRLTFTAVDNDGNFVQLDSIRAEKYFSVVNTPWWAEMLRYPDTVIVIPATSVQDFSAKADFDVVANENPFVGKTSVEVNMPAESAVNVTLAGVDGRVVADFSKNLHEGGNLIEVSAKDAKPYILTVGCKFGTKSVKLLNTESNTANSLVYAGSYDYIPQSKLTANENLSIGDTLRLTAYVDIDGFRYRLNKEHIINGSADIVFSFADIRNYEKFTDERDGNTYRYVQIGSQTWMAENLRYLPSVNGNPSVNYSNNQPRYYVYNYAGENIEEAKNHLCEFAGYYEGVNCYRQFGVYYNGPATIGACPSGWHLPTDAEWTQLEIYLQNNGYNSNGTNDTDEDRETNNFTAKALASACGWDMNDNSFAVGNNPEENNSTGFGGYPCGASLSSGEINLYGAYWWTDTDADVGAYYRSISEGSYMVYRTNAPYRSAMNVRCVRD
ncbi:MAG: fibrobacter succinogenes major paralogous domain-containing protein [Bacteroidales bacterium]|nr:fibrobacter succinogenes major paralogous domain-containing protein [Bacteroidales bacterium]